MDNSSYLGSTERTSRNLGKRAATSYQLRSAVARLVVVIVTTGWLPRNLANQRTKQLPTNNHPWLFCLFTSLLIYTTCGREVAAQLDRGKWHM